MAWRVEVLGRVAEAEAITREVLETRPESELDGELRVLGRQDHRAHRVIEAQGKRARRRCEQPLRGTNVRTP